MIPFDIHTPVRQVVPTIEGDVLDVKYDAPRKTFTYLVGWTAADGQAHSRWFDHGELAAQTPAEEPAP